MDADQLVELVRERYGDPREPRFDFVAHEESRRPYEALVATLAPRFDLTEDTDLNDDVCFGYVLRSAHGEWLLQLSMVGRVAVLMRLGEGERVEVVDPSGDAQEGDEGAIATALRDADVALLGAATLSEPVDLALHNTDPGNVRLYQALFTDVDVLPWQEPDPAG